MRMSGSNVDDRKEEQAAVAVVDRDEEVDNESSND